jgi:predicted amidophosphoribosyltransferase
MRRPVRYEGCQRVRATRPQVELPYPERRRNLRGAFVCELDLAGCHVALIDDVMTSGASLDELAKAVRKAGAARVSAWVVARAITD